jgi:hypothetical protein
MGAERRLAIDRRSRVHGGGGSARVATGHWSEAGRRNVCQPQLVVAILRPAALRLTLFLTLSLLFMPAITASIADAAEPAPSITEVAARDAEQTSVTLTARIDPAGFETHYYFEWGPTSAYGNRAPAEGEATLGGTTPGPASATLTGLAPASNYHYRLVADSGEGRVAEGPDQEFETLDACGLPEGRCLEMVSPREPGPTAAPGLFTTPRGIYAQAASDGPGAIDYTIEGGLPDATRSAEVLYQAGRSPFGWASAQISPGITAQNEQSSLYSSPNLYRQVSPDLSCGLLESSQPLTPDSAAYLVIESGGFDLYRRDPDGGVTLVTNVAPEDPGAGNGNFEAYEPVGMSADCDRIVFAAPYHYPGVEAVGTNVLYEWDDGVLKGVGYIPGPSGPVAVEAHGGAGASDRLNAVSQDGSRVFFSATRLIPGNPADAEEEGAQGLFVRENGETIDVSASETVVPDRGAAFQGATPDGSHVYFTANAQLTEESSVEGTDLYEYDLTNGTLTDLSVGSEGGGASVGGLLGFADDGSHVYFAARGQLVSGVGRSYAENITENTFSVFDVAPGAPARYVGLVTRQDLSDGTAIRGAENEGGQSGWTSRVSADGRFLLFQSRSALAGYNTEGTPQIYLYDGQTTPNQIVCVSCVPPGQPRSNAYGKLLASGFTNQLYAPLSLTDDGHMAQAFFVSGDVLAPDALKGEGNLYEWSHGQIFLIAHQGVGTSAVSEHNIEFFGASANGSDMYFADNASLNWEDPEGRFAVWDARRGGGFPEPPPPPPPCESRVESSCQGVASGGPTPPSVASSSFTGPGNHKKKHHKKKHHKKKHHKKKHQGRHADGNRGASK